MAPRTPTEKVLAGSGRRCCAWSGWGCTMSFLELGGHSLLATRVVSRVAAGVRGGAAAAGVLRGDPRWRIWPRRVEEIRRAGAPALPPVAPTGRTGPLPLSFAQERLWLVDQMEPGSTALQHPHGMAPGGCAGRGGAGARAGRDRPAPRGAADHVRGGERISGAGDRALRRVRAAGGGAVGPERGGSRGGARAACPRGGGAALRPRGGPALPCGAAAAGRRGPRAAALDAPRRQRRLEHGRALPRAVGAVRGVPRGRGVAARGAGGAVRRLCRLAARAAGGRGAGAAAGVLEGAPGGSPGAAGAAHGPSPPCRADVPGRHGSHGVLPGAAGAAAGAGADRGGDAVHGAARRIPGAAEQVQRQRGRGGGQPHRGTHAQGGGGADRLLRQHAGAAHRPFGRSELPRAAGAGAGGDAGRVRAPGDALRKARGGAEPGALPEPLAALPGVLHPGRRPGRRGRAPGARRAGSRNGARGRQVRPVAGPGGDRPGPARRAELQHRPLRAGHRGAHGAAPGAGAGAGRLGRGPAPFRAGARGRGGAGAAGGGPRHRVVPRRGAARPALRGAGTGAAGRARAHLPGDDADVPRAERARQPPGAPAARAGRGPGGAGGDRAGALGRAGRHHPRRAQGRRRVRPARPRLPGGAHRLRPGGRRRPGAGDGEPPRPAAPRLLRRRAPRRHRRGRHRPGERREPGRGGGAGHPGVRHLHVGIDGKAEGGAGHARQRGPALRRHGPLVRLRTGRRVDALPLVGLRLLGLGDLGRAPARRPARRRPLPHHPLSRGLPPPARRTRG